MDALNQFEVQAWVFIQDNLRSPFADKIMTAITTLGDKGIFAIAVCLLLLALKKYRRTGLAAAISLAAEFILVNLLLKNIVARIRPYEITELLTTLGHLPGDKSFPSGHAGSVFAVASVLVCWMPRKWGIPAILLAALIALSRLYVGVHYPTDVLAAVLIGCITGWAARMIVRKFWPGKKAEQKDSAAETA